MLHEISAEAWEDYLNGTATADVAAQMETHLPHCAECRQMIEQLQHSAQAFQRAAQAARQEIALPGEQVYQGLRNVFLRLLAEEAEAGTKRQQIIEPWLRALELALGELCGRPTAVQMMQTAARRSPARALANVETDSWQPFLSHLTSITQVVCGEPGAQLIGEIGRFPLSLADGATWTTGRRERR